MNWLGCFLWVSVRVGVRVNYIIIIYIVIYLYNKKHGSLQQFLSGTVSREQDSEAKCMGSNHGVGNRLVDLAMKNIIIE